MPFYVKQHANRDSHRRRQRYRPGCRRCACAAGWTVVIAGRKVETLERTRQLAQGSGLIETHVADVTDDASVEQLFDAVVERSGRLALLFNNAGINVPPVPLDQLSTPELRSIIATNLLGSFLCARGTNISQLLHTLSG